jgi:hypothetical protein
LCLNFVQGGRCHVTGGECHLGMRGDSVRNMDGECKLHGKFDIWVTQENDILITDMGIPSAEPKQCLALGINQVVAKRIAIQEARKLGTNILTTRRKCFRCARPFWVSDHDDSGGLAVVGQSHFCPFCIRGKIDHDMERRLGALQYWCG